jgi:hypothetical protein
LLRNSVKRITRFRPKKEKETKPERFLGEKMEKGKRRREKETRKREGNRGSVFLF